MIREKLFRMMSFLKLSLTVTAAIALLAGAAKADVRAKDTDGILDGYFCVALMAGQSIDAGDVCVGIEGTNLVVVYKTEGGWELTETHLWLGKALADMPQTKSGNPKIGNFPYNSGALAGTSYTLRLPLTMVGIGCDTQYYFAAHAVVRKADGSGGYQTETGWGSGTRFVDKGSWATYFMVGFECYTPQVVKSCETGFAKGDITLNSLPDTEDPTKKLTNRWGWEIVAANPTNKSYPIYAGAGQNDVTKGTLAGYLQVSYSGSQVNVEYTTVAPFTMRETHLYVGANHITTAAPGQFGNIHEGLNDVERDSYVVAIATNPIYIVAHAVVCH